MKVALPGDHWKPGLFFSNLALKVPYQEPSCVQRLRSSCQCGCQHQLRRPRTAAAAAQPELHPPTPGQLPPPTVA